jgi:hypothetical protein
MQEEKQKKLKDLEAEIEQLTIKQQLKEVKVQQQIEQANKVKKPLQKGNESVAIMAAG